MTKAMDKDGDGKLSPEEEQEVLKASGAIPADATPEEAEKMLKEMDADGDGKVSPEELQKGVAERVPISIPEFKERAKKKHGTPQAVFDAFDTNPKDGKISPEEFAEACKALVPPVSPTKDAPELFKNIDKNGDGGISPEELFGLMGGCGTCKDNFGVSLPEFKKRAK